MFLPLAGVPEMFGNEVVKAVGKNHHIVVFDRDQEIAPQFEGVEVIVDLGGSVGTREMLHAAKSVKLWQVLGMGLDHFDLDYWRLQGMPVAHCPGPLSAIPLGECALMFILMLARRYHEAHELLREGVLHQPPGVELENQTLGIVGFGASGRELAFRAKAFGMKIEVNDVVAPTPEAVEHYGVSSAGGPERLDELLPRVDYLSVHLPLDEKTHHIIDARRLGLMKKSACLINVARGELVDEEALVAALSEGRLAGAGLDVFGQEPLPVDSPLLDLPNVVLLPHVSGSTDGTARRRAALAAENCDRVAAGLEPLHRVA
jgi:phosphoglycerate dehydrogenase-like enzyme